MNYSKVKSRIKTAIIILLSFALVITGYQAWHIHFKYNMTYKYYETCYILNPYPYNITIQAPDRYEYRKLIDKEFNTFYWLTYKDKGWKQYQYGKSSALFRHVIMNTHQKFLTFEKGLAHELAHIKYQTLDDGTATYKAIITLYESENNYLKYVAIEYANDVLMGAYEGENWDCGYYLLEYFKETNEKIVYF